jgi:hypothetical protein
MSEFETEHQYSPDPNFLERWAAHYLRQQNPRVEYPLRERRAEEIDALWRMSRQAVIWAAIAGILSGGIIGGIELFVRQGLLDGMEGMSLREQLPYWAGYLAAAGVVSAIEILFLYWNALRGVAQISDLAGIPLQKSRHAVLIVRGLSRVALELPSPRHSIYGIDPYAQMSRWKLTARSVLYRMKVGLSSFILRILLRRILGRLALRGLIPLFTGPLYAAWNAFITWRIMHHARENALGPFAIEDLIDRLTAERDALGAPARDVILQGMGELIMRNQDAHPNHVYLLSRLMDTFDITDQAIDVDWPQPLKELEKLETNPQRLVVITLTVATVLAGKVRGNRKAFLEELYSACGQPLRLAAVHQLRDKLMHGQRIADEACMSATG